MSALTTLLPSVSVRGCMSTSLALLAQPHANARFIIVQELLKPSINISRLVVGYSEVRPDGDADLPVYIDSDAYSDPDWPYRGSVTIRHKRIDLNTAFGQLGLRFHSGPVFNTVDAFETIGSLLQIQFTPADYIHDLIPVTHTNQMVTIRAAPDSPRWKGQVDVFVYR